MQRLGVTLYHPGRVVPLGGEAIHPATQISASKEYNLVPSWEDFCPFSVAGWTAACL